MAWPVTASLPANDTQTQRGFDDDLDEHLMRVNQANWDAVPRSM